MSTTKNTLQWWESTINHYSSQLPNGMMVTAARRGPDTRITKTTAEVANHHLRHATDAPEGHYLAAYTAARATQPTKRGEAIWKLFAIIAGIAGLIALALASGGNLGGVFLLNATVAVVTALLVLPLARWNLHRRRNQFHNSIQTATDLAGADAADAYATSNTHLHRTIVHNLLTGDPLTPKAHRQAILSTIPRSTSATASWPQGDRHGQPQ